MQGDTSPFTVAQSESGPQVPEKALKIAESFEHGTPRAHSSFLPKDYGKLSLEWRTTHLKKEFLLPSPMFPVSVSLLRRTHIPAILIVKGIICIDYSPIKHFMLGYSLFIFVNHPSFSTPLFCSKQETCQVCVLYIIPQPRKLNILMSSMTGNCITNTFPLCLQSTMTEHL